MMWRRIADRIVPPSAVVGWRPCRCEFCAQVPRDHRLLIRGGLR